MTGGKLLVAVKDDQHPPSLAGVVHHELPDVFKARVLDGGQDYIEPVEDVSSLGLPDRRIVRAEPEPIVEDGHLNLFIGRHFSSRPLRP